MDNSKLGVQHEGLKELFDQMMKTARSRRAKLAWVRKKSEKVQA